MEIKNGRRIAAVNTLSKRFHNWFYAGWVVSNANDIQPKTIRGTWKPVVITEEFEIGLEILSKRAKHRNAKRTHNYLLRGLVFVQDEVNGNLLKLTGSTSNTRRPGGGTAYYCIYSSNINILCEIIDQQVFIRHSL